jgi:hypothetical protein
VSDRPAVRPVPSLARASARYARTHATGRTNGTNTERAGRHATQGIVGTGRDPAPSVSEGG